MNGRWWCGLDGGYGWGVEDIWMEQQIWIGEEVEDMHGTGAYAIVFWNGGGGRYK